MVLNLLDPKSQRISNRDNLVLQELSHAAGEYKIKFK